MSNIPNICTNTHSFINIFLITQTKIEMKWVSADDGLCGVWWVIHNVCARWTITKHTESARQWYILSKNILSKNDTKPLASNSRTYQKWWRHFWMNCLEFHSWFVKWSKRSVHRFKTNYWSRCSTILQFLSASISISLFVSTNQNRHNCKG